MGLVLCVLAALSAPAAAQDSEAETLFQDGRALMLEGRFEEACPKLEQSQQLEPRVGTMLNLAVCHERVGMTASAWVEFQQARDAATAEGRTEQAELAQARIDVLGPRVPWLTVSIEAKTEGLAVALDGAPVDPAEWGEPMAIDPGEHVVVVAAPEHVPRELRFTMAEAQRRTVSVARLDRLPEKPPPTPKKKKKKKKVKKKKRPAKKDEPEPRPWIVEAGLFGGYFVSHGDRLIPQIEEATIELRRSDVNEISSCEAAGCDFELDAQGGFIGGLSLYGGYVATDWLHVGGRVLGGIRVGGGALFAVGPTATFRVGGPLWLGLGAVFGTAGAGGEGEVRAYSPYFPSSTERVPLSASIEFGGGPMLEIAAHLFESEYGALRVMATPLVLFGAGQAFSLPFGVAYRFQ